MIEVESDGEEEEILLYDKRKLGKSSTQQQQQQQTSRELKVNNNNNNNSSMNGGKKQSVDSIITLDASTAENPESQREEVPNFSIFGGFSTQQLNNSSSHNTDNNNDKNNNNNNNKTNPPSYLHSQTQQDTYTNTLNNKTTTSPQSGSPLNTSSNSVITSSFFKREKSSSESKPFTHNEPKFKRLRQLNTEEIGIELDVDDDVLHKSAHSNDSKSTTETRTPSKEKEEKVECPFCFKYFPSTEIESHVQGEMDAFEKDNKQPKSPTINKPKIQTLLQPLPTTNRPITRSSVDKTNSNKKKKVTKIGERKQSKPKKNVKKYSNDEIEEIDSDSDSDGDSLKDFIEDDEGFVIDDGEEDQIVSSSGSENSDFEPNSKREQQTDHTLTCPYCSETFRERDFDDHLEEEEKKLINTESFSTMSTSSTARSKRKEPQKNWGSSSEPIDLDDVTKTEIDDDGSPVKLHFNAIGNTSSSVNYTAQFERTNRNTSGRSDGKRNWGSNNNSNNSNNSNSSNKNYYNNNNSKYRDNYSKTNSSTTGKYKKSFNKRKFFAFKNRKRTYTSSTSSPKSPKTTRFRDNPRYVYAGQSIDAAVFTPDQSDLGFENSFGLSWEGVSRVSLGKSLDF